MAESFCSHNECRAHRANRDMVTRILDADSHRAAQLKLDRDAATHPGIRAVLEEMHDSALADLANARNELRRYLRTEAEALRERFKHEHSETVKGV